jgi:hypothetical protein
MDMKRLLAAPVILAACCAGQPAPISLERPASVGMPVWLRIPPSNAVETYYPFAPNVPASFGCKKVEVRRNGKILAEIGGLGDQVQSTGFATAPGNPCNSVLRDPVSSRMLQIYTPRLPLHVLYRFDQPGVYEVRFTEKADGYVFPRGPVTTWTGWTPIEIQPGSPEARANWLAEMKARPTADAIAALTDFLPNILADPNPETLQLLGPYLYHSDREVRRYAGAALNYWPANQAEAASKEWLRTKGPSDGIIRFLARGPYNALPDFDSILEIVLPYLQSDSPVLVEGALAAAYHLTGSASYASPELRRRAENELIEARDHIRAVVPARASDLDSLLKVLPQLRDLR